MATRMRPFLLVPHPLARCPPATSEGAPAAGRALEARGGGEQATEDLDTVVSVADNGNSDWASPVHHETPFCVPLQNQGRTRNRLVKPIQPTCRRLGRRIRLRGLLTENPAFAGISHSRTDAACITRASRDSASSSAKCPVRESDGRRKRLAERNTPARSRGVRFLRETIAYGAKSSPHKSLRSDCDCDGDGDGDLVCANVAGDSGRDLEVRHSSRKRPAVAVKDG